MVRLPRHYPERGPGRALTMASFSCTPTEWEEIRTRAQREGMTVSAYVVEGGLTVSPTTRKPGEARLVLPASAQTYLFTEVTRLCRTFWEQLETDDPERPGLIAAIRSLFEAKVQEMLKTGRYEELVEVLKPVVGEDRATEIATEAYETYLGQRQGKPTGAL